MDYYAITDVGKVRSNNEDAYAIDENLRLFMVCDGVGGNNAGEIAAQTSCELMIQYLNDHIQVFNNYFSGHKKFSPLEKTLLEAVEFTNSEIHRLGQEKEEFNNMACTMTLMIILDRHILTAHVGDSRLYMCRDNEVHNLTKDHTVARELIDNGIADPEIENGPLGNVLCRSIGTEETAEPDIALFEIQKGDRLLLCSDGLTRYLPNNCQCRPFLMKDSKSAAEALVSFSIEKGGEDNITVLTVFL